MTNEVEEFIIRWDDDLDEDWAYFFHSFPSIASVVLEDFNEGREVSFYFFDNETAMGIQELTMASPLRRALEKLCFSEDDES